MTNQAMQQSRAIVVDEVFPHRPEAIWATLVRPDLMARWLKMTPIGFAPVVGNLFTFKTTAAGAWDGTIRCEVTDVVPDRRLAFRWQGGHADNVGYGSLLDTLVTLTLERAEDGTRLRVVHSGFELPHNESAYRTMSGGWTGVVARVGELAGERA